MSVEERTRGKHALSRGNVVRFTDNLITTETTSKGIAALSAANHEMVFTHVIYRLMRNHCGHVSMSWMERRRLELMGKKVNRLF
jgi:hypothetical protein